MLLMPYCAEQAHPIVKVSWTVMTCIYKVCRWLRGDWSMFEGCLTFALDLDSQTAKAQQKLDRESQQLAEDLSVMLAYVASCKDLVPVKGRESIVLRAVRLSQEGACLIDAFMEHKFAGRVSAPFSQSGLKVN